MNLWVRSTLRRKVKEYAWATASITFGNLNTGRGITQSTLHCIYQFILFYFILFLYGKVNTPFDPFLLININLGVKTISIFYKIDTLIEIEEKRTEEYIFKPAELRKNPPFTLQLEVGMYTLTEIEEKRKRNIFSNTNQQNLGRIHLLANSLR